MTAADILTSWRAVQPALRRFMSWVTLLTIAEAGEQGISRADLTRRAFGNRGKLDSRTERKWQVAGLVTIEMVDRPRPGGPKTTLITITPKGLKFLRLS